MTTEMRVGPVCNRGEKRVWVRELHTQDTVFRGDGVFLENWERTTERKEETNFRKKKKQEKLPRETREQRNNETL
jgi:hypothetical protein